MILNLISGKKRHLSKKPETRFSGLVHNQKIFVFGGFNAKNQKFCITSVETYNPTNDTWELIKLKQTLNQKRAFCGALPISFSNEIFLFGGGDGENAHK